jgi:PAS domain S-box-containing protein
VSDSCAPKPAWNEQDRLKALESYDILDTPKEEDFEGFVKMAAQACNVPVSLISLVSSDRQWFKAEVGTGLSETPLGSSICSHAILQKDFFVVEDTTKDSRTCDNPLVSGNPNFRFYAGAVLETAEGLPLGTVCVLDYKPRTLSPQEQNSLKVLAKLVMTQLELRRSLSQLRRELTARKESEERFRAMSDNIAPLAWMAKADGMIFWFNRRWYEYTGGTLETMQGNGWEKSHDPEHLPHVVQTWRQAITHGTPWKDTFPLRGVDGKYRWFLSRAYPIRDEGGAISLWFGTNTDITELRDAQNALKEANTLLGDKAALLESIVQERTQSLSDTIEELRAYSYSISHDLRAPLRAMIGYSDILTEDYSPQLDQSGQEYLARIRNAGNRMDRLIQDVLVYSRLSGEDVVLESVDADALIREIIHSYPNLAPDVTDIVIKSRLPVVKATESLLTQCFSNLLENGSKFVAPGVKPRMEVWGEAKDGRVRLFFKDNGIGISEQHQESIFNIFQRVGRDTDGTGIGLAIVRKAVEKMGGTMGVESKLGKGSLFWFDLQPA